ncbi:MAG: outer rane efflux protein [Bryobacterales bacterium]|nr:outer rane efflux protein [Bryobacterales bacterium]
MTANTNTSHFQARRLLERRRCCSGLIMVVLYCIPIAISERIVCKKGRMTKIYAIAGLFGLFPAASIGQDIAPAVLGLSLKQAIETALSPDGNTRLMLADELVRASEARLAQSRAALLPILDGSVREQNQRVSLASFGLQSVQLRAIDFPDSSGPFSTFDARAAVTYSLVDLGARRRARASVAGVEVAKAETGSAREQVAADVARAYLVALRAEAAVDVAQAGVDLAKALLIKAQDRNEGGHGLAIDVTRAQAQVSIEQQRLMAAKTERERQFLQLLNAIELRLDLRIRLTDRLSYTPAAAPSVEEALAIARKSRPQFAVLQKREERERLNGVAIRSERLPSLIGYADYGALVAGVSHPAATHNVGIALRLPLLDGGRRKSRLAETAVQQRIEKLRERELRNQVELEIRQALASLGSAEQQVKASEEGVTLAEQELAQARRRFEAGVSGNLDVTEAQTRMARARDNRVEALFRYQQARVDLSQATGTVRALNL